MTRKTRPWGEQRIPIVPASDFISEREAAATLGIDGVTWRVMMGILHPAMHDGTKGVTRASVEAEAEWQRHATRWMRMRRAIGGLLQWF